MNTLLVKLHQLALKIRWCRKLAIVTGMAGLGGVIFSLFVAGGSYGHWLEPSLVLTLWGMMLFAFIQMFQKIPPPVLPGDDFITRLGSRIVLACYSLLALLVIVVSIILMWMSYRLIYLD